MASAEVFDREIEMSGFRIRGLGPWQVATDALRAGDIVAHADASISITTSAPTLTLRVGVISDTQHGNRGGGALHANATTSVAGFMSAADKTKVDGLGTTGPAGSDTQIQYNNAGALGASANLVYTGSAFITPAITGTATSAGTLTLKGTTHATPGKVQIGAPPGVVYDEATGVLKLENLGTVTVPSLQFVDATTGFYRIAPGVLALSIDGTQSIKFYSTVLAVYTDLSLATGKTVFTPTLAGPEAVSGATLVITSTSHPTKGKVQIGGASGFIFDEVNTFLGVGIAPTVALYVKSPLSSSGATFERIATFRKSNAVGTGFIFEAANVEARITPFNVDDANVMNLVLGGYSGWVPRSTLTLFGSQAAIFSHTMSSLVNSHDAYIFQASDTNVTSSMSVRHTGGAAPKLYMVSHGSTVGGNAFGQSRNNASAIRTENSTLLAVGTTSAAPLYLGTFDITRVAFHSGADVASGAAAAWNAVDWTASTLTFTGTDAVDTTTGVNAHVFRAPTITAAGAVAVAYSATVYIAGAPAATGSASITNPLALWVDADKVRFDGQIMLNGVTYTFPGSQGGAATYLKNDGAGALSWDTPAGGGSGELVLYQPGDHVALAGATEAAGSYTLGAQFRVNKGGLKCTGGRVYVNEAQSVRIKLWDESATQLATADASPGAAGVIDVAFASAVNLTLGTKYKISVHRFDTTDHLRYTDPAVIPPVPFFAGVITYLGFQWYDAGDEHPDAEAGTNRYPVGPLITTV